MIWNSGLTQNIVYEGTVVPFPLGALLVIGGSVIALWPELPAYLVLLYLPDSRSTALSVIRSYLDARAQRKRVPLTQQDAPQSAAEGVAQILERHRVRSDRRFTLVMVLFCATAIILPFGIVRLVDYNARIRASQRLAQLVQETRLEFASADLLRRELATARQVVEDTGRNGFPVLAMLVSDLETLYGPTVEDAIAFGEARAALYKQVVASHADSTTGVLKASAFDRLLGADGQAEEHAAVSVLTVRGVLANDNATQGTWGKPYLQARQLLSTATKIAKKSGFAAPSAENALGVCYAGLMKGQAYTEYVRDFTNRLAQLKDYCDETAPLTQLALARKAEEYYSNAIAGVGKRGKDDSHSVASAADAGNFALARYKNNLVDLHLTLLYLVHVEKQTLGSATDQEEKTFLEKSVYPTRAGRLDMDKLVEILQAERANINSALMLSKERDIFFTSAQLAAVSGAVLESHAVVVADDSLLSRGRLRETALADLGAARANGMPADFFTEKEARRLYLGWLFEDPVTKMHLESLASRSRP